MAETLSSGLVRSERVTIRVPASTSNLGSGFDTLGLAVQLYNSVTVTKRSGRITNTHAIIDEAIETFFELAGLSKLNVQVACKGNIPIARGLGFSSTVRIGVLAGLNVLTKTNWTRERVLQIATELEGHPDNASPAVFGGFTVSARRDGSVRCLRFPVSPEVRLVTLIPNFGIETELARKLMPQQFTKADAAHALNRAAIITAAFAQQDYDALRGFFDDRFHQPYREKLVPQLPRVIDAGVAAGAIGGWLSGSGSAIMCMTFKRPKAVAEAMRRELPESEVLVLKPENHGYRIQ